MSGGLCSSGKMSWGKCPTLIPILPWPGSHVVYLPINILRDRPAYPLRGTRCIVACVISASAAHAAWNASFHAGDVML